MSKGWLRFRRDDRGMALVEGALILAFLLPAFLQMIVITQYYGATIRASQAADGIANMVGREVEMSKQKFEDLERAAAHFLYPYPPPVSLTVAQVVYLSDGDPSLARSKGGWVWSSGPEMTSDADLKDLARGQGLPGEALVVVELLHRHENRIQYGPALLPEEIEAMSFTKTRSGRPIVLVR